MNITHPTVTNPGILLKIRDLLNLQKEFFPNKLANIWKYHNQKCLQFQLF